MNHGLVRLTRIFAIGIAALAGSPISFAQSRCEPVRVTASDPDVFESFGFAVAVSGDTVVIGAEWDRELGTQAGAAYVFRPDPDQSGTWVERQKLWGSDQQPGDEFAHAVAMDGETAVIGALQHIHDGAPGTGSVYVFRFDADTSDWIEEQELLASTGTWGDGFGVSVSLSGDVAVIGALFDDDSGAQSGAAYVFRFDPDTSQWIEEQKLLASDGAEGDFFGRSVAVFGDIAVIGANADNDNGSDAGSAYIFRFDPERSGWFQEQKLLPSDGSAFDEFGRSAAIDGDAVVIGARLDGGGSAYVFRFDPKTSQWVQEQKLEAANGGGTDQFGFAVALDAETAVIGAWGADVMGPDHGAAYVFRYDPAGEVGARWAQQDMLLPDPGPWTAFFGWSVAIDGETAVIGAHGEDQQRGAAYVFDLAPNCNCPHDLDADGNVGVSDLLVLLASWGPCQGCPADFDGNDNIGVPDLLVLLANWGPCR